MTFAKLRKSCAFLAVLCVLSAYSFSQKTKAGRPTQPKQIIFGVIYDGSGIEPIAFVENGKLTGAGDGGGDTDFSSHYYKPGAKYNLIFGGAATGNVTIKKSNIGTECGGTSAEISTQSAKARLKGFVMGLATNVKSKTPHPSFRRMPTAAERTQVEALVRAEYSKNKVPSGASKQLHSHNLTALDVNGDGVPELVGSYWVAPKNSERGLLFFIAERNSSGKYSFNYSEYENFTADKVMSGELKDLEDGMYQTLLLDTFDYDSDGTAEIFTIGKAFEGNNYVVFKRTDGKWAKTLETYDYRCGY